METKDNKKVENSNDFYTLLENVYYCVAVGMKKKAIDCNCEVCSTGCRFYNEITNAKRELGLLDW